MFRKTSVGLGKAGFTLTELLVTIGVIAILATAGMPAMLRYYQTAGLTAGSQELAAILNRGRQLAIRTNNFVCVEQSTNQVRFRTATAANCTGTIWTGDGTDASGWLALSSKIQVSAVTTNVIFTYLGAANPGGTYTVRHPVTTSTQSVVVSGTGRVTIQ
jgi:prepilin-type N-terminal cleavage/methylation domain-containing protein